MVLGVTLGVLVCIGVDNWSDCFGKCVGDAEGQSCFTLHLSALLMGSLTLISPGGLGQDCIYDATTSSHVLLSTVMASEASP